MKTPEKNVYEHLVVNISDAWVGVCFPDPETPEAIFLRSFAEKALYRNIHTGSVGIFGGSSVSLRSDDAIGDAVEILKEMEVDISLVRFNVSCGKEEKGGFRSRLKEAGASMNLVEFDVG